MMQCSTDQNGTSLSVSNGEIMINGEKIEKPEGMEIKRVTQINGDIFISGYEFIPKTKTFKKTLKAFWYLIFA